MRDRAKSELVEQGVYININFDKFFTRVSYVGDC